MSKREQRKKAFIKGVNIVQIINISIMILVFFFGNGIMTPHSSVYDITPTVNISVDTNSDIQADQDSVQNCDSVSKGYESFDTYKGTVFTQHGKIYRYSGSYTSISDISGVTKTYYKYYYTF